LEENGDEAMHSYSERAARPWDWALRHGLFGNFCAQDPSQTMHGGEFGQSLVNVARRGRPPALVA
jgi:hypothetical protein